MVEPAKMVPSNTYVSVQKDGQETTAAQEVGYHEDNVYTHKTVQLL